MPAMMPMILRVFVAPAEHDGNYARKHEDVPAEQHRFGGHQPGSVRAEQDDEGQEHRAGHLPDAGQPWPR
jgi:hypothetical protein